MDTIFVLVKQLLFVSSQSQSMERKDDNKSADKIQKHLHVDNNYGNNLVNESNFQLKNLELEKQKLAYLKKQKKDRVILNRTTASVPLFHRFITELRNFGNEFKENLRSVLDELIKMGFTVTK